MTGADLESVKATIAKLITLANNKGATENESAVALDRAKKLMAKYQLDEASVLREKIKTGVSIEAVKETADTYYSGRFFTWEHSLGWRLAPIFECKAVRGREMRDEDGREYQPMHFVGLPNDMALTLYFFDYCQDEIGRHMESAYPNGGQRVQNSFALGMVSRIVERLDEFYKRYKEEMGANCTDIVIYKEDAIKKTWDREFPFTTLSRTSSRPLSAEYMAGRAAGDRVHLSSNLRQVNGND